MPETNYDIIVIGSGPGGYIAAIRAAQLGFKTAVIEYEGVGGTCLNWGCIATKALLASGDVLRTLKNAKSYGIQVENYTCDFPAVIARSRKIVARMAAGIKYLFKKNNIDFIEGYARLQGNGKVEVEQKDAKITLAAKHIIIATGARPAAIKGLEADGELILNSRHALLNTEIPESMLIVGGGAIGLEFADLYNAFGAKVTIVEAAERIIPSSDAEIADMAAASFAKQGIEILSATLVKAVQKKDGKLEVTLADKNGKETIRTFAKAVIAVGVAPNVEDIGLDKVGITLDKGHIPVDEWLKTSASGIYAIGDVVAPPWLGHKASAEGIICVEKIAGVSEVKPLERNHIPFCIYSSPQIAGFGLTEEEANAKNIKVNIGRFPMQANGKAQTSGHTEGMAKVILDTDSGEVLGAWLFGADVTELINGIIPKAPLDKIFPHPTLSEVVPEAFMDAYGRALNI